MSELRGFLLATDAHVAVEPKTDEIKVKAAMKAEPKELYARLSKLQMVEISVAADTVRVARVESRDIQKRPFLFILTEFSKDSITVSYTIPIDSSPKLRRLAALEEMLGISSLVTDLFVIDPTELFQYIDSAISDAISSLSQNYSSLFNSYDSIYNEYKELKRQNMDLVQSNRNLSVQAVQLSNENKKLQERLTSLEVYSDQAMYSMVTDWLESHGSEIDVAEFAGTYKLTIPRVEEVLNRMVSLGYISLED